MRCLPSASRRLPASPRSLTAPGTAEVAKQAFYSWDSCLSRLSRGASAALCAVGSEAKRLCEETHRKYSGQCGNTTTNSSAPLTQRWRSWRPSVYCQNQDCKELQWTGQNYYSQLMEMSLNVSFSECVIECEFREWVSSVQYAAIIREVKCFTIAKKQQHCFVL